jgi:hypothetical protein
MQLTIGMGYLALGQTLLSLLRCLLVNSTKKSEESVSDHDIPLTGFSTPIFRSPELPPQDKPRERRLYRRLTDSLGLLYVASMVTGGVGNATISQGLTDKGKAKLTAHLRYIFSSERYILFMTVAILQMCKFSLSVYAYLLCRLDGPLGAFQTTASAAECSNTSGFSLISSRTCLITYSISLVTMPHHQQAVVPVYRLAVTSNKTQSFDSTAPGSLNAPMEKAGFYVFHIVPEWILATIICGAKTREIFNTGPNGDNRWRDETPEEKTKREKKEQEEKEKKEKKNMEKMAKEDKKEMERKEKKEKQQKEKQQLQKEAALKSMI